MRSSPLRSTHSPKTIRSKNLFWLLCGCFLLIANAVNAQRALTLQQKQQLRRIYSAAKHPEIPFARFVEINSHLYDNAGDSENEPLALSDYCTKVRPYCNNGDFESGLDQNQYVGAYGTTTATTVYPNPFGGVTYGFSSGAINSSTARQTIVDNTALDPTVGIPRVPANGGTRALRLGNNITGAGYEIIAKTVVVDANETILNFFYAVVFEDPNHNFNEQPAFSVRVYDCANGTELTNVCNLGNGSNVVVSDASNPFFQSANNGNIAYRNWSQAQINLSAHIGKTVSIIFTNKDCSLTGHYGYTYLDNMFSSQCPIDGTPTTGQGNVEINAAGTTNCGIGQVCLKYRLPFVGQSMGTTRIALNVYQNSSLVTTLNSPVLNTYSTDSNYCFSINPATLGINTGLTAFDYTIVGTFVLGATTETKILGNPPTGFISGVNNDYFVDCGGPIYYSKSIGDLHNMLTWGLNPDGSGVNPSDFNDSTFQLANRPSGLYSMTSDWTVNGGTVNIPTGSQLQINGYTFSISQLDGAGTISGSTTSNLSVISTNGGNIPLRFTPFSNMLNNLTVNSSGTGATATLNNTLNALNIVTLTSGMLNTNGFLTLKSSASNTARVSPITGSITGDVTVERYIPARRAWRILSAPVGGVAGAATGQATMTHSQETVRGTLINSTGGARPLSYGTTTFSLNAAQTALTMTATIYNIDVNGLQTPADNNDNLTAAHIHVGAFIGANAGVRWGFFGAPDNDVAPDDLVVVPFASGVGGTFTTKWDLNEGNGAGNTLTSSLPDILKGLAYINFHTVQFGGGEIRGQISLVGAGTQTINQAWQEGVTTASPTPNPFPGYGAHITGGPMFGSTANGFDQNPGAESSIKMYNPNINNWEVLQNTNATSVGSQAYMTFVRGDRGIPIGLNTVPPANTTLRAKGPLKVGDQFYPVSGNGFTAIGNPFASPINFATLTRVGVQNNFYLWDPKMGGANGVGAYVLLSDNGAGGYTIVPAPVSPESQYIQSGQGFLVRPTVAGTAGSVTIKESDKSATPATDVFRTAGGSPSPAFTNIPVFADPQSEQGLRIDLKSQSTNGDLVLLDETFASYKASHSNKLDDFDAVKMENIEENLGIENSGQIYMLERRQLPKEGDLIELKLWNTKSQTYVFELSPVRLSGTGLNACVEDRYLKTLTPISLEEKSKYQFSITGNAASAQANRFAIVFKKGLDAVTLAGKSLITAFPNPIEGGIINLSFSNKAKGVYQVTLLNSTGQIILRRNLQHAGGSAVQPLQLERTLAKGIYRLNVSGADGETTLSVTSN